LSFELVVAVVNFEEVSDNAVRTRLRADNAIMRAAETAGNSQLKTENSKLVGQAQR
jgi:hypothetical protein